MLGFSNGKVNNYIDRENIMIIQRDRFWKYIC
jgi:hypothetical protein